MKLFNLSYVMCTIAIFTACGHKEDTKQTNEISRIVKVKTDTVKVVSQKTELHYSGTIEPQQAIPLTFEGVGTVEKVFVQEGDIVKKGQILATINKADDISMNKATVAKYKQAKDAYDRLKNVYEKGSLAEIKWIEIKTTLEEAEAQMQLSKSSLKKCSIYAPQAGIIGRRNIEPGQSSLSLKSPIELVKVETILVKVSVAENEISQIKIGQKANLSISALNGKTFEGTVSKVGVVADEISRTYEVKIMAKNPNLEIKPGMVCDVNLNSNIQRNCLFISNNAVSKDNEGKNYVFILSPNKNYVKKQPVILGKYHEKGIEIVSGLHQGQIVVVEGKEKLSNNSLISL